MMTFLKDKKTRLLAIALVATCIVYMGSLNNELILNWDDGGYIVEHEPIQTISWENIKIISTAFYKGNYHPLTTFFYALEYQLVGEHPLLYHINNLLFHLLNVWLVFLFVNILTKNKYEVSFIVALLFGIHPMHVESVAWISERKDVLYTFFFLGSLLLYNAYLTQKKGKISWYVLSLLAFALSLFSKSAAVALPVVIVLVDWYKGRKFNGAFVLDKLPYFAMSIVFGILAILSQDDAGAIQNLTPLFSWPERIMLASYGTMTYFYKLFVPIDLSAMYPYPDKIGGSLPLVYQIAPFVVLTILGVVAWSYKYTKDAIFGMLLFFGTIILVLQLLPVGGAVMAERYTYVPYIGLFFILAKGYTYVSEHKNKKIKSYTPVLKWAGIIGIMVLSVVTMARVEKWEDGEKLFIDVTEKYPNLPFAYNNLGYFHYRWSKNNEKAEYYYSRALVLDSTMQGARSNRGVLYFNMGKLNEAVKDFTIALQARTDKKDAWIGRANTYSSLERFAEAIPDYNEYIVLCEAENKPDINAYVWRGIAYYRTNQLEKAKADFMKAIALDATKEEAFYWLSYIYYNANDFKTALTYFDQCIALQTKRVDVYSLKGLSLYNLKLFAQAVEAYNKALELDAKQGVIFAQRSGALLELKRYNEAFNDVNSAAQLGFNVNPMYYNRLKQLAGR